MLRSAGKESPSFCSGAYDCGTGKVIAFPLLRFSNKGNIRWDSARSKWNATLRVPAFTATPYFFQLVFPVCYDAGKDPGMRRESITIWRGRENNENSARHGSDERASGSGHRGSAP